MVRGNEKGLTMAEIALIMPMLILLMFGMTFTAFYAFRSASIDWGVFITGVASGSHNDPNGNYNRRGETGHKEITGHERKRQSSGDEILPLAVQNINPNQELTADYDRLNQVLSNLISNALRHTPKGGTISIETGTGSSPERSVRVIVKDSGLGIAPEDLPFIFDRFWRADKSRSERTHSGLGLAITKQLIHAHGGTIEAQSVVGKGSDFIIELPEHLHQNIN